MRITSWNCNMKLRAKYENILSLNSDIFIIQECEQNHNIKINNIWIGDNKNKGIGIFSEKFNIEIIKCYNPDFKYIIPIRVNDSFNLLAVWKKISKGKNDTNQLLNAFAYYKNLLVEDSVIIGDFNNNYKLDRKYNLGEYKFENVVNLLNGLSYESVYHKLNENHGEEVNPTFFLQRNFNKPHHLDYCFTNMKYNKIEIGNYNDWIKLSDHMPIVIDF